MVVMILIGLIAIGIAIMVARSPKPPDYNISPLTQRPYTQEERDEREFSKYESSDYCVCCGRPGTFYGICGECNDLYVRDLRQRHLPPAVQDLPAGLDVQKAFPGFIWGRVRWLERTMAEEGKTTNQIRMEVNDLTERYKRYAIRRYNELIELREQDARRRADIDDHYTY